MWTNIFAPGTNNYSYEQKVKHHEQIIMYNEQKVKHHKQIIMYNEQK